LDGGIDSGFHHVTPEEYKPRLFQVKGKGSHIAIHEVSLLRDSLNSGDVFILDTGKKIFQWNGSSSSGVEKNKASTLANHIANDHGGHLTVLDEDDDNDDFWSVLGGKGPIKSADSGGSDASVQANTKKLLKISEANGKLNVAEVATGKISKSLLEDKDVFILDIGEEVYVWIGKNASVGEKSKGLHFAEKYLRHAGRPEHTSISRVLHGGEPEHFLAAFDN